MATKTLKGQRIEVPVSVSSNWRWNGRGTEDYKMGDEVQATAAGGWALSGPLRRCQVNFRHHDGDDPGVLGRRVAHGLGNLALHHAGRARAGHAEIAAYGYWQIRAYEHTSGPELIAPYHLSFGLSYSFLH